MPDVRDLLCILALLFQFAFLVRLALSFFPLHSGSPMASVRDAAVAVTDPVVVPVRRAVPPLPGALSGFGVAEIIVLVVVMIITGFLCG